MSGSYRECPECGKRALSIATRCPGCGRELPPPEPSEDGPGLAWRRLFSGTVAAAVLATVVVVALATVARTRHAPTGLPSHTVTSDSGSDLTDVAYARAATPSAPDSAGAEPDGARLMVARSWTSVRKARHKGAMLEAVLLPGDTVVADSLEHGWYRVALEGEVLGYAHRSTLTAPAAQADSSVH